MGSLGFLTPFDFKFHEDILREVLSDNVAVLLRTRLNCSIVRDRPESEALLETPRLAVATEQTAKTGEASPIPNDTDIRHLALNEVVIDRGPNSYLSNLDFYINDRFITKVQGDGRWSMFSGIRDRGSLLFALGLIISTPTGSTAYAMAGKRILLLDCLMRTSCESSWCFHGSSQCSRHRDLSYLSAFPLVSSDRRASWYRTQSESVRQFSTNGMAFGRWQKPTRTPATGQVIHLCTSRGL